jgi:hypothetical protein
VLNEGFANTNFGSSTQLQVGQLTSGYTSIAYLQFDLSSISAGATINSASLSLYGNLAGTNPSFQVDAIQVPDGTFNQSIITYNNAPVTGIPINSFLVPGPTPQTYTLDVTSYVQQVIASGVGQVTIALVGDAPTAQLASFNSTNAANNAPSLAVNYQ